MELIAPATNLYRCQYHVGQPQRAVQHVAYERTVVGNNSVKLDATAVAPLLQVGNQLVPVPQVVHKLVIFNPLALVVALHAEILYDEQLTMIMRRLVDKSLANLQCLVVALVRKVLTLWISGREFLLLKSKVCIINVLDAVYP